MRNYLLFKIFFRTTRFIQSKGYWKTYPHAQSSHLHIFWTAARANADFLPLYFTATCSRFILTCAFLCFDNVVESTDKMHWFEPINHDTFFKMLSTFYWINKSWKIFLQQPNRHVLISAGAKIETNNGDFYKERGIYTVIYTNFSREIFVSNLWYQVHISGFVFSISIWWQSLLRLVDVVFCSQFMSLDW